MLGAQFVMGVQALLLEFVWHDSFDPLRTSREISWKKQQQQQKKQN